MTAVYLRELRSYFITPIGYIYAAMFLAVSGLLLGMTTLMSASTTSLAVYFIYLMGVFCILIPLLTMKLLSDERRTKTEQLLLTSPVSLFGMIMGKYLASLTVFAATLLLNSFNFFLLYMYGTPNGAIIAANVLGLFFLGAAFIAVGTFLSSITENQLIAAVSAIAAIGLLILISYLADKIPFEWVRNIIDWFSVLSRYAPFTNGQLDISAIIYFISFAAVFLFLTVRVYEKRRWS